MCGFNIQNIKSEISFLVEQNNLNVVFIDVKGKQKGIGFSRIGDTCVCSLGTITLGTSIRKTKKRLKRFLEEYSKENNKK